MHRTAADQSGVELESSPPLLILEEDRPGEEIALSPEKQRAVFAAQLARERETFRTFFQQKTSLLRESYRKKLERVAGENNSSSIILRDHRHSERAAIPTRRESSRGSSTSTGAAGGGATGGASLEGGGGVRSSSRRYFTSTSEQQEFELMYKFYSSATRTSSNSEDDNLNTQDETEPPRAAASDEQELLRQENARLRRQLHNAEDYGETLESELLNLHKQVADTYRTGPTSAMSSSSHGADHEQSGAHVEETAVAVDVDLNGNAVPAVAAPSSLEKEAANTKSASASESGAKQTSPSREPKYYQPKSMRKPGVSPGVPILMFYPEQQVLSHSSREVEGAQKMRSVLSCSKQSSALVELGQSTSSSDVGHHANKMGEREDEHDLPRLEDDAAAQLAESVSVIQELEQRNGVLQTTVDELEAKAKQIAEKLFESQRREAETQGQLGELLESKLAQHHHAAVVGASGSASGEQGAGGPDVALGQEQHFILIQQELAAAEAEVDRYRELSEQLRQRTGELEREKADAVERFEQRERDFAAQLASEKTNAEAQFAAAKSRLLADAEHARRCSAEEQERQLCSMQHAASRREELLRRREEEQQLLQLEKTNLEDQLARLAQARDEEARNRGAGWGQERAVLEELQKRALAAASEKHRAELESVVAARDRALREVEGQLEDARNRCAAAEQTAAVVTRTTDALAAERDAVVLERDRFVAQRDAIARELEECSVELDAKLRVVELQQSEATALEAQVEAAEEEKKRLEAQVERGETGSARKDQLLRDAESALSELAAQVAELESQNKELEDERSALKKQGEELRRKNAKLVDERTELLKTKAEVEVQLEEDGEEVEVVPRLPAAALRGRARASREGAAATPRLVMSTSSAGGVSTGISISRSWEDEQDEAATSQPASEQVAVSLSAGEMTLAQHMQALQEQIDHTVRTVSKKDQDINCEVNAAGRQAPEVPEEGQEQGRQLEDFVEIDHRRQLQEGLEKEEENGSSSCESEGEAGAAPHVHVAGAVGDDENENHFQKEDHAFVEEMSALTASIDGLANDLTLMMSKGSSQETDGSSLKQLTNTCKRNLLYYSEGGGDQGAGAVAATGQADAAPVWPNAYELQATSSNSGRGRSAHNNNYEQGLYWNEADAVADHYDYGAQKYYWNAGEGEADADAQEYDNWRGHDHEQWYASSAGAPTLVDRQHWHYGYGPRGSEDLCYRGENNYNASAHEQHVASHHEEQHQCAGNTETLQPRPAASKSESAGRSGGCTTSSGVDRSKAKTRETERRMASLYLNPAWGSVVKAGQGASSDVRQRAAARTGRNKAAPAETTSEEEDSWGWGKWLLKGMLN